MNEEKVELLQGNEACALAGIKGGIRFYGGYPITPSSEIAEVMSRELPKVGGVFIQMEDEIGGLAASIGARIAGKKAMTATSGPGYSLMQEHIGYAAMVEVPVLIVNAMRGGPSTGLPTKTSQGDLMQARWGTHGDHPAVALTPSSIQEVYDFTIKAINLAEYLRMPVSLLMDEVLSHLREKVRIPEKVELYEPKPVDLPPEAFFPFDNWNIYNAYIPPFGTGYRYHLTGLAHRKDGFPTNDPELIRINMDRFKKKIEDNLELLTDYEEYLVDDAEILIVAVGSVARAAKEAVEDLRDKGLKVGVFRPKILWPFPRVLGSYEGKVGTVFVAEMNQGQLIYEVERYFKSAPVFPINRYDGELMSPDEIKGAIRERLKGTGK